MMTFVSRDILPCLDSAADPGFPRGGANAKGGANLLFVKKKFQKLHENWTERGGRPKLYYADPF